MENTNDTTPAYDAGEERHVARRTRSAKAIRLQHDGDFRWLMGDARGRRLVTFLNNAGTAIGVTVGGTGAEVPVFDQSYYTFYGLTDASNLSIRRVDTSNTQVTVAYRWEA